MNIMNSLPATTAYIATVGHLTNASAKVKALTPSVAIAAMSDDLLAVYDRDLRDLLAELDRRSVQRNAVI